MRLSLPVEAWLGEWLKKAAVAFAAGALGYWCAAVARDFAHYHSATASVLGVAALLVAVPCLSSLARRLRASPRGTAVSFPAWFELGALSGIVCCIWTWHATLRVGMAGAVALVLVDRLLKGKPSHAPRDPSAPIRCADNDELERGNLVAALAREAAEGPHTVVALLGELGCGKSSILQLVRLELEKRSDRPVVVRFSAWLPASGEGLAADLVEAIEVAVRRRFVLPGFTAAMRGYVRALAPVRGFFGALASAIAREPSQRERLGRLCRAIESVPARVVVLVDEIDRMDGTELRDLMKLLRGVPEIRNICFVCAVDPVIAAEALAGGGLDVERVSRAATYLEKFFASWFYVPAPPEEKLQAMLLNRVRGAIAGCGTTDPDALLRQFGPSGDPGWRLYRKVFRTPRSVIATCSAFHRMASRRECSLNATDLFHLAALLHLDHGMATTLYDRRMLFVETESVGLFDLQSFEYVIDQRRAELDDELKELIAEIGKRPRGDSVVGLLGALFPRVRSSRLGRTASTGEGAGAAARIFHPRFFMRYLTLAVPASQYPEAKLAALGRDLVGADRAAARNRVLAELSGVGIESAAAWDFLRQLGGALTDAPASALHGVVDATSEAGSGMQSPWDNFAVFASVGVIGTAAERLHALGEGGAPQLLVGVVESSPGDGFAAVFLGRILAKTGDGAPLAERVGASREDLLDAYGRRLAAKYYPGGSGSLFVEHDPMLAIVLHIWATCGPVARIHLRDYIRAEIDRDHRRVGRFFAAVQPPVGPGASVLLDANEIRNILRDAAGWEQQEPGSTYSTEAEKNAVEAAREQAASAGAD